MAFFFDPSYVLAAAIVFMVLCPCVAALRITVRLKSKQNISLGIDDWLVIPATLLVIGCAVTLIIGVRLKAFAYPTPVPDPSNQSFRYNEQLQWAFFLMQILGIGCTKLSFVFLFRRIFCVGSSKTPFSIASAIVGLIALLWTVAFFFWFLFSCPTDLAARWKSPSTYIKYCPTDGYSDTALGISDFLTDLSIIVLPIPMVFKLHTTWKRKLTILAVFALGLLALVFSTIRMVFVVTLTFGVTEGGVSNIAPTEDHNLVVTEALYWSMLESGFALIACCLPMSNGLFQLPLVRSTIVKIQSLRNLLSTGWSSSRGTPRTSVSDRNEAKTNDNKLSKNEFGIELTSQVSSTPARHNVAIDEDDSSRPIKPGTENSKLEINIVRSVEQTESLV